MYLGEGGEGGGRAGEEGGVQHKRVLDGCLLPHAAKASNLGRWNFTWDGQAGLGHPPREGGVAGREDGLQVSRGWFLEGSKCLEAG